VVRVTGVLASGFGGDLPVATWVPALGHERGRNIIP
jgi:hypothetical protein